MDAAVITKGNLRWICGDRLWEMEGSQSGLCCGRTVEVIGEASIKMCERPEDGGQAPRSH